MSDLYNYNNNMPHGVPSMSALMITCTCSCRVAEFESTFRGGKSTSVSRQQQK